MYQRPMPQFAHARQQRERAHANEPAVMPPLPSGQRLALSDVLGLSVLPPTPTASIYLPTHRTGSERHQDHIKAKNLVNEAWHQMTALDGAVRSMVQLDLAHEAILQPEFWEQPQDGLALFCNEQGFHYVWLPATMPEVAVVSRYCHIKPIMPLIQGADRFYLLELTQHGVRLHVGSRSGLQPLALPGVPTSVDDIKSTPKAARANEARAVHGAGPGAPVYLGADGDEQHQERIRQYFLQIDTHVCGLLHADHAPLILAGADFLLPLYHQVNHYAHLMAIGIPGSPDLASSASLHERAWEIAAQHYHKGAEEAGSRYAFLASRGQASNDIAVILPAEFQGRVSELFVASDVDQWGAYDPQTDRLHRHSPRHPEDEDLLNFALIQALRRRARVHVAPKAQQPGNADIVAYFRF